MNGSTAMLSQRAFIKQWLTEMCPGWEALKYGDPVVYRVFSGDGTLLYIGSTIDLLTRFLRHYTHSGWLPEARRMTLERWPTLTAARAAEKAAIAAEEPPRNRAGTPRDGRRRENKAGGRAAAKGPVVHRHRPGTRPGIMRPGGAA